MDLGIFVAPTEFKFDGAQEAGYFSGYGSVYGILDSHKDVIEKGAFDASIAAHKAKGTMPGLYAEHSVYQGGDPLPVGVYTEIKSDDHGLYVAGKISNLDTDHGKRIHGLMKDGALKGLSIAYSVPAGGARMGKKQGEPRRTLSAVDLFSVDLVSRPSNSAAQISEIKSQFAHLKAAAAGEEFAADVTLAIDHLAMAIMMQDKNMSGDYYYNSAKQMGLLMERLRLAYKALTGDSIPEDVTGWVKSATIGGIRTKLVDELGLSRKKADDLAKSLFETLPRDEAGKSATDANVKSLRDTLSAFSLPSFNKS